MKLHLDKLREEDFTISLLLTRQCNFECDHCMYECGPRQPRTYMSNEVLAAVRQQVRILNNFDIRVSINLIGGEPTLNMKRFSEILDEIMQWPIDELQMTTNGWWLEHAKAKEEFMRAVRPYVNNDGTSGIDNGEGRFSVRISNDEFHNAFRKPWYQGQPMGYGYQQSGSDKLQQRLSDLWEGDGDGLFESKIKYVCGNCGRVAHEWRETCSKCHSHDMYEEYEDPDFFVPAPNQYDPWIYVESFMPEPESVRPQGRGRNVSRWNDGSFSGGGGGGMVSFLPNGKAMDFCSKGSWMEFGDVHDNPLFLQEVARVFWREERPGCWDCRALACQWAERRLKQVRKELSWLQKVEDLDYLKENYPDRYVDEEEEEDYEAETEAV